MPIKKKEYLYYPLNYDHTKDKYKRFNSKWQAFKYAEKKGGGEIWETVEGYDHIDKVNYSKHGYRTWIISPD